MGYDLHGCNPIDCNYENYPTLSKWEDKSWDERRDQMSEEVSDKYWKEMSERDSDTGAYFRANVWGWRELWSFTCGVCFKVMTEDDRRAGDANDGIEITEETCANMVPLMKKVIENKLNIASGEPTPQKRRKIYRKIYKDTQDELKKN